MKKYIIGLFLMSFMLVPVLSFAQVADPDPNPTVSDCVTLQSSNLRYKARDINTNGEVSTLQDFLQSQGYLNNEPTGYFGLLTVKAVKSFQKSNGISPTGYVGLVTRAKIKEMTCEGTVPTPDPIPVPNINAPVIYGISGPQILTVNQTGTWTVKAKDLNNEGLSYSVNWGDIESRTACSTINGPCAMVKDIQAIQQSATFTHSYSQAGMYVPTFTVTNNSGQSAKTSLSVNVGGITIDNSTIKVIYPNGGEKLVKGDKQVISWQDNETLTCKIGDLCDPLLRHYDISLVPYYAPCTSNFCPLMPYHMPYIITQKTTATSFGWLVGNVINWGTIDTIAPDGSYTIQVCRSGTEICDSSDSFFRITTPEVVPVTDVTPRIMYWWGKVNQHIDANGNWGTDPDGVSGANLDKLNYCKKWFPNTTSVQDYKSETTNTWRNAGNADGPFYSIKMSTKCVQDGIISTPSITVLSPNGGESYTDGQQITINWASSNIPSSSLVNLALFSYDANNNAIGSVGLTTPTANDGTEVVTLPTILSMKSNGIAGYSNITYGKYFKIMVGTPDPNAKTDLSDNLFTIQ